MKTSVKYIFEQVIVNVIINFLIAFFLGRYTLERLDRIPLWPAQSAPLEPNMSGDILLGTFILTFILTMIITAVTQHNLRKQNINNADVIPNRWLNYLPKQFCLRALTMALIATFTIGLGAVLLLVFFNIAHATSGTYIIVHSTYAALLAGLVTLIAAKRVFAE